jgi:hypothetical protein
MTNNFNDNSIIDYKIPLLYDGEVMSIIDEYNTGQIKVKLGLDGDKSIDDLPVALPLLPKYINIFPKVGERVTVLMANLIKGNQSSNTQIRFWIGPWISQPERLNKEDYISSFSDRPDGYNQKLPGLNVNNLSNGVYPTKDYIAIQGRDNADLWFKNREVLIRSGKFVPSKPKEFNKQDPGYIQIRYLTKEDNDVTNESKTIGSSINVVSNYINLLSHKGKSSGDFVLTNQDSMITNKDQSFINTNTHPIPYGDVLVEFLGIVKDFVATHTHAYHGMVPDPTESVTNLLNFDLNSILNNNVRTN